LPQAATGSQQFADFLKLKLQSNFVFTLQFSSDTVIAKDLTFPWFAFNLPELLQQGE